MSYLCYNYVNKSSRCIMNYSKLIKTIRESLFLTQRELAEVLNVSYETINRWERNKFNPSMKQKKKIVEFCQKNNIDYFKVTV